jgi:glutamate 5-kinase
MKTKKLTIAIKLGSALLTDGKGKIKLEFISEVCRQVAQLMRLGHRVLIVTSGAIASDEHLHRSKNLRAAIGQGKLISLYAQYFHTYGLQVAQLLLTDEQLTEGKTAVTEAVIQEAFRENVVCVINANDVVASTEIKALEHCADNDVLTGLVCRLIDADLAIIGLAEDGVRDNASNIIRVIHQSDLAQVMTYAKGGNKLGHGENGMRTKIKTLGALAVSGTRAIIAPGKQKDFILRAASGEKNFGTVFLSE